MVTGKDLGGASPPGSRGPGSASAGSDSEEAFPPQRNTPGGQSDSGHGARLGANEGGGPCGRRAGDIMGLVFPSPEPGPEGLLRSGPWTSGAPQGSWKATVHPPSSRSRAAHHRASAPKTSRRISSSPSPSQSIEEKKRGAPFPSSPTRRYQVKVRSKRGSPGLAQDQERVGIVRRRPDPHLVPEEEGGNNGRRLAIWRTGTPGGPAGCPEGGGHGALNWLSASPARF